MKTVHKLVGVLVLSTAWTPALAVIIDFDDIAPGTYSQAQFNRFFSGVTFENNTGDRFDVLAVVNNPLYADFSEHNAIQNIADSLVGNTTLAIFDNPVDRVSVTMGDFGVDVDQLFLNAYDTNRRLVGSDRRVSTATGSMIGYTVAVSAPRIAYVEFYGEGFFGESSVLWDNFAYTTVSIPEPPVAALFILGLAALRSTRPVSVWERRSSRADNIR